MNRAQRRQAERADRRAPNPMRRVDPLAGMRAIGWQQQFEVHDQTKLALPVRLAFDALLNARAIDDDIETLAMACNVTLIRAESIGAQELIDVALKAGAALMNVKWRHQRTARFGLDHQDRRDIPPMLDLYEELLGASPLPKCVMPCCWPWIDRVAARCTKSGW